MKEANPNQEQLFSTRTVADAEGEIKKIKEDIDDRRSDNFLMKLFGSTFGTLGAGSAGACATLAWQNPFVPEKIAFGIVGAGSAVIAASGFPLAKEALTGRRKVREEKNTLSGMITELNEQSKDIRNGETVLFDPGSFKGEMAIPTS